jgi:hypothetical protein
MDVIGNPELRAEVLRALHKLAYGLPTLSARDLQGQALSPAERGLIEAAHDEELALLNALLDLEDECRRREWAALDRLLALCQFEDGLLDQRLRALPGRAFARAALDLYQLGWISQPEPE